MLMMPTLELGHPVLLVVLLITNYASLHVALLWEPPLAFLVFAFYRDAKKVPGTSQKNSGAIGSAADEGKRIWLLNGSWTADTSA